MGIIIEDASVYLVLVCWLIAAIGCARAIYSPAVRDSALERCALACMAITFCGNSYRIYDQGWVSEGGRLCAVSIAFYVCSIELKRWYGKRRVPSDKLPAGVERAP